MQPFQGMERPFAPSYIPDREFVTFKYADEIVISATTNVLRYQWRANGLYDPNKTATGAQPVGFDEWATLYDRYRVVYVIHDIWISSSTGNGSLAAALVPTADDPGTSYYYVDYAAMRRASCGRTTNGGPVCHVHVEGAMSALAGMDPGSEWIDTSYSAAFTSNPAKEVLLNLCVETSGASDGMVINSIIQYRTVLEWPETKSTSAKARALPTLGGIPRGVTTTNAGPLVQCKANNSSFCEESHCRQIISCPCAHCCVPPTSLMNAKEA
jgi:hypothetical protein